MSITRRGFLGLLASAGIMAAEARPIPREKQTTSKPASSVKPSPSVNGMPKGQLLIDHYFPILKFNEGEKLHFYHRSNDSVTVGYGTNVESHSDWLSDVTIYFRGRAITKEEKKSFISTMVKKIRMIWPSIQFHRQMLKRWL